MTIRNIALAAATLVAFATPALAVVPGSDYFDRQREDRATHGVVTDSARGGGVGSSTSTYGYPRTSGTAGVSGANSSADERDVNEVIRGDSANGIGEERFGERGRRLVPGSETY